MRKKCVDCEYFRVATHPSKGLIYCVSGTAMCTKHDIVTDFRDEFVLDTLLCVEHEETTAPYEPKSVPTRKEELAVSALDMFTKIYCIKENNDAGLVFECSQCEFLQPDGKTCCVKQFKNKHCPEFKDFGSMGDL